MSAAGFDAEQDEIDAEVAASAAMIRAVYAGWEEAQERVRDLDARNERLDAREAAVAGRERWLQRRDAGLDWRERSLDEWEQRLQERERLADQREIDAELATWPDEDQDSGR